MRDERKLSSVPAPIKLACVITLLVQVAWHAYLPRPKASAQALLPSPSLPVLQTLSLGEPIALSQLSTLYLQAFDNQPGISVPFAQLDYVNLEKWIKTLLSLDPIAQYPLFMAAHLYTQVPEPEKQRRMLELIYFEFFKDPDRRWRWLAHATILAKHQLKDLPMALRYATAIERYATSPKIPNWARQMRIFVLEDMGELESAKILLGGLLASGKITDPSELRFLTQRLETIKAADKSSGTTKK